MIAGRATNRFVWLYNSNPGFRAFVQARIRAGELTRGRAAGFVFAADDDPDSAFPPGRDGPFGDFAGDLYTVRHR